MIAGTTKRAATSRAPTTESAAVVASAIRPSRTASRSAAERPVEPGASASKPRCSQRCPTQQAGEQGRRGGGGGERDVAAVDQQQAAEEQGLDVGARAEDVAGEDHAGGEAGDEDDRDDAVARPPRAAARARSCRR